MPVTQTQIAKHLNLSQRTVSYALRGTGPVSVETRKRVVEAAKDLGYRHNASASAMRTGRTGCIAILANPLLNASHLSQHVWSAMMDAVSQHGGFLASTGLPTNADLGSMDKLPRLLGQRLSDGLLLNYSHEVPEAFEQFIQRYRLPSVWINNKREYNSAYPDDFMGGRLAAEYLLKAGHRKIAYLDMDESVHERPDPHYSQVDRGAGYAAAMREAGLAPQPIRLPLGWYTGLPGERQAESELFDSILKSENRPTAVICYRSGPLLLSHAMRSGLEVPRDLSIIDFCNEPTDVMARRVSHFIVPNATSASRAVELLFELIDHGELSCKSVAVPYDPHLLGDTVTSPVSHS